jgi:ketosteroid isomerase-like protein
MESSNLETLRTAYEALVAGDLQAVVSMFAPDIKAHVPGRSPVAGDYEGVDAVSGYVAKLMELSEGTLRFQTHSLMAEGEHGAVLINDKAERPGKSLDANNVHVWHLGDGKLREIWIYPGDVYAWDEFWSD